MVEIGDWWRDFFYHTVVVFSPLVLSDAVIQRYTRFPQSRDLASVGPSAKFLPKSQRSFLKIMDKLLKQGQGFLILNYLITPQGKLDVSFPTTGSIIDSNLLLVISLSGRNLEAEFHAEAIQTWDELCATKRKSFQAVAHQIGRKIHSLCMERGINLVQDRKHVVRYDLRENRCEFQTEGREITKCELRFFERVPTYESFMQSVQRHFANLGFAAPSLDGNPGVLVYENVFEEKELKWLEGRIDKKLLKVHPLVTHFNEKALEENKSAGRILHLVQSHLEKCQLIQASCIDSYDLLKIVSNDPTKVPPNLPQADKYSGLIISVQLFSGCHWYSHEPRLTNAMMGTFLPRGSVYIIFPNSYASTLRHRICGTGNLFSQVLLRKKQF